MSANWYSKFGYISSETSSVGQRGLPGISGSTGPTGPQGAGVGTLVLNDITDVSTAGVSNVKDLRYNGSNWVVEHRPFEMTGTDLNIRAVGTNNAFLSATNSCAIGATGGTISQGSNNVLCGYGNTITGGSRCFVSGLTCSANGGDNSSVLCGLSNVVQSDNSSIISGSGLTNNLANTAKAQNLTAVGTVIFSSGTKTDGFLKGNSAGTCSWADAPETGQSTYSGTISASGSASLAVTFSKTYASAPKVICSMNGASADTRENVFATVFSTSTTGATVNISNQRGSGITNPVVDWIAL